MTDVKIRCDDCKFVENCVDYGWKDCKKFTQKPSTPMTNFENITKSEESLAEWLGELLDNEVCDPGNWNCKKCFKWCHRDKVVEWLKEIHHADRS